MKRFALFAFLVMLILLYSNGMAEAECAHSNKIYVDLGYQHQRLCSDCGQAMGEPVYHEAHCYAPTTCDRCGLENLTIDEHYIYHWNTAATWVNLGDTHQQECSDCGKVYSEEPHFSKCTNPTECNVCGAVDLALSEDRIGHYHTKLVNLGDQHQWTCVDCGEAVGAAADHRGDCTDPTTCGDCGATGIVCSEDNLSHYLEFVNLGNQHCLQCLYCDYQYEKENHEVSCTDPTYCFACGAINLTVAVNDLAHYDLFTGEMYGSEYVNLGEKHQEKCLGCGNWLGAPGGHDAKCDAPNTCYTCGAVGDDFSLSHNGAYVNFGETHQFACNFCDYKDEEYAHSASCTNPTHCVLCGADGFSLDEDRIVHAINNRTTFTTTDTTHTYTCATCKKAVTGDHFAGNTNICFTCGYTVPAYTPGDANNDGETNMRDALALLKKLAGWDVVIYDEATDVNADGTVNMRDALLLLKYLAGWDVTLQ